jgi:hypothetical protein
VADLIFVGQFVASKAGKTGLTVIVDVDRYTMADGTRTALVTAGSATEGRRGLYHYRLASADLALYQYVATFITADTSVDQQEVAALGLVVPDALVSSRLAPATAGRSLAVDTNGYVSADVVNTEDVADAVLLRDWTAVTGTAPSRSTWNALRFLRNKWAASGGMLQVFEEDDTTVAWEALLTTNAGPDRITGSTPE